MNGTGSREASEVTLMIKPSPRGLHVLQGELHQLDLTEHKNLKLARDYLQGQKLGRPEMAGSGIVN